ncbi:carbon storage regulator CsrA [Planomicrobium okeanokoites]|uniref:Translational regulator CsrA n=1 Tax=Planomicrobium okeanokoites TaxID=244 RepID=A0ABV7KJY0_PLAOK|nr:carbon storage regulator CsrA [Planomicrobium okeanokoites]MCM3611969.1 carbon storage regulator CsrA [Planococcus sp. MER TA 32b]TAA69070.1 carbon storage regulator [Planomicrobium okeanokoites]
MLVLGRKKGESIIIDDQIEIIVTSVEGETVKLGIEAPKHITIHRKEVYLEIQEENKKAMSNVIDIGDFLKMKK